VGQGYERRGRVDRRMNDYHKEVVKGESHCSGMEREEEYLLDHL
jgi:hypothetical protein